MYFHNKLSSNMAVQKKQVRDGNSRKCTAITSFPVIWQYRKSKLEMKIVENVLP